MIHTNGGNLGELFTYSLIDSCFVWSNQLYEILNFFGIEALRLWIEEQIDEVMTGAGTSINRCHIKLLADTMTYHGVLMRITRQDMLFYNKSIIRSASFEKAIKTLKDGGLYGETDPLLGNMESLFVGNRTKCGTGFIDVKTIPNTVPLHSFDLTPQRTWKQIQLGFVKKSTSFFKSFLPSSDLITSSLGNSRMIICTTVNPFIPRLFTSISHYLNTVLPIL